MGIMEIPSVPEFYKPLSLRLCKILDNIGASEEIRKLSMETSITHEIVKSSVHKPFNLSWYMFGSRAEGTSTTGLHSDTDSLYCHDRPEVYQSTSDIPLQRGQNYTLILVRDKFTKPGYCKLQVVVSGTPITRPHRHKQNIPEQNISDKFRVDCYGRVVRTAVHVQLGYKTQYIAHGPAMSAPPTSASAGRDFVGAYRCCSWPHAASEWPDRERPYGWPSLNLIEKMITLGFFVVKVGHPHSNERDLEYRISLSLQERLLMCSINPTQFKCYILLKMIKKDVINKKLGTEAISSYHCKTCLFYMIENTPGDLWQPRNLLACLQGCLKCICKWVKSGNCPNYFIPEENMFEGRIDDELRIKLRNICFALLTADCSFLSCIQCDDIATRIMNSIFPGTITLDSGIITENLRLCQYIERIAPGPASSKFILPYVKGSATEAATEVFKYIYDLSHAKPSLEHTTVQIRNAACVALPYLEISLISITICSTVELGDTRTVMDLLLSSKWQELSYRADSFSAMLKQATFLYMLGQYEACQKVLSSLVSNCLGPQISSCNCRKELLHVPNTLCTAKKGISLDEFRTNHYVLCIVFSSFEEKFIPTALAYETLRAIHMPSGSWNDDDNKFQPEWAVVDGKIYLYFLMFLLSQAKGALGTWMSIFNMEMVLETDRSLKHRETAMNLLGWCYKQEGNIGKAMEYFYKSLALVKGHNAAFWHILFTTCEMISRKNKQRVKKI